MIDIEHIIFQNINLLPYWSWKMSNRYSQHKILKKAFEVVASEFSNFFADKIKFQYGIRPDPKSIKIQSIDIKNILGRDRELYLVDIPFSSDAGIYQTRLFIKTFKDQRKVFQEASGSMHLEEILKNQNSVRTPKLLYYSKEWNILVFEGIYADDFDKCPYLSIEEKYFLAGLGLPVLHGSTLKEIDLERYYLLLEKSISQIKSRISSIIPEGVTVLDVLQANLVKEIEQRMFYSHGGGISFGDFHSGNMMFERINEKIRNLNKTIDNIQIWLIDCEFTDFDIENADRVDRFEDIGTFFAKNFLEEFSETQKIKTGLKNLKSFLTGYNSIFKKMTGIYLHECYPKGTTFEFQIAQTLLFDLLYFIIKVSDLSLIKKAFLLRIDFINYLLNNRLIK